MKESILEEIGLTKSEIKVYLALLELGSSPTGKIVDKSKATSSKIYEILDRLIDKGLVSYIIKSGVKYYEAAPPERIIDYLVEKEKRLAEQKNELKNMIPELELKRQLSKYKSEATIYKGIKGVETAFYSSLNLLKPGEEFYAFGVPARSDLINRFFLKFTNERKKRDIAQIIMFNENAKDDLQTLPDNRYKKDKVKFIPQITPAAINIFKDRVIIFPETKEPLLFVIDNKEVAESFKVQFDMLWNQDVIVTKGMDALKIAFDNILNELNPGETYEVIGGAFGTKGMEKTYIDFFTEWHRKRMSKGIKSKILFQEGMQDILRKNDSKLLEYSETKELSYKSKSPVAIFPYHNKTLLMIQEKNPTFITINNKEVTDQFKDQFNNLWNQDIKVDKGLNAVVKVCEDMLNYNSCDWISARGYFWELMPEYAKDWEKRAAQIGFKLRNIVDIETKGKSVTKIPFCKTKYILPKEFSKLSVFYIYGNKVVITNWMEKDPIIITIDNKHLYDMYEQQFELLWKQELRTLKGYEGMLELMEEVLENRSDLYLIGATGLMEETHKKHIDEFYNESFKRNIKFHILANENIRGKHFNKLKVKSIKYLPENIKSPFTIWVFNDNVAYILSQDPQIITFTKNKEIAESYKHYFYELWENAAKE